jgi:hypothetical protein
LRENSLEDVGLHRFADVGVHPGREAGRAVVGQGVGGQGDNFGVARRALQPAYLPRGLVAVHLGHLTIHHDRIVRSAHDGFDGLAPVAHAVDLRTQLLELKFRQLLIDRVVFRQ